MSNTLKQWEPYRKQDLKGREIMFQDVNGDGLIRRRVADESTNYVTTENKVNRTSFELESPKLLYCNQIQVESPNANTVFLVPKEMIYLVKKVVCVTTTVCK